ncbi:hypothetical protein Lalb_Chr21g0316051 [Lupinus albus]|uniref:Uncharacterized protein n=1 Tax=Lupinus albus TaxID=3870 RepID=A0A6A4NRU2_LUPAL|nr:hypothetical protein Lalb_Chr21g0316051 [Lupinus albus]
MQRKQKKHRVKLLQQTWKRAQRWSWSQRCCIVFKKRELPIIFVILSRDKQPCIHT